MCIRDTAQSRHRQRSVIAVLQYAYQRDDVRLVRRTTVLLTLLVEHVPVEILSEQWGISPSCIYQWRQVL